jgi:tetratricopeptide (TPR) repeat protein
MNKDNLLFGILGLLVGAIIGFIVANSLNRSYVTTAGAGPNATANQNSANPALPPDHPPLGGAGGQAAGGGAIPQVSAAIERARQSPQDYEAQMTAGDLYYQISRFDDAIKFYEAAAKLRPSDAEPLIKAGNAYFDSEKYEDAERYYSRALEKDPKNLNVRTDLGLTYYLRTPRDIDRAIKEYNTVLSQDANNEITLQNLALAFREKGDQANYNSTIERLRKINPQNPAVLRASQP